MHALSVFAKRLVDVTIKLACALIDAVSTQNLYSSLLIHECFSANCLKSKEFYTGDWSLPQNFFRKC